MELVDGTPWLSALRTARHVGSPGGLRGIVADTERVRLLRVDGSGGNMQEAARGRERAAAGSFSGHE